jgi:hypothetical protein
VDLMYRPPSEREARRAQAGRDELAERVARAVSEDGVLEAPATAWATQTPRTSPASTSGSSANRLCATWNGFGKAPERAPPCKPIRSVRSPTGSTTIRSAYSPECLVLLR